jgi:hypothetical protein
MDKLLISQIFVESDSRQIWKLPNGRPHRTDGPAVIYPNGDQEWWVDGKRHRSDGPAILWNGKPGYGRVTGWWLYSLPFTFEEWLVSVDLSDEEKLLLKLQYG